VKKNLSIIIISSSLLFGCATEPGETTVMGAAAGGAIGAGLGAIVGSQTGDPGAGLAIGLAAGTAAGAAVGNQIQAQDEEFDAQDEVIQRQQRVLDSQKTELAELKGLTSDHATSGAQGSASLKRQLSQISTPSYEKKDVDYPKASYREENQDSFDTRYKVRKVGESYAENRKITPTVPSSESLREKEVVKNTYKANKVESAAFSQVSEPITKETEVIEKTVKTVVEKDLPVENKIAANTSRPSSIFSATNSEPLWTASEEANQEIDTEKVKAALNDNFEATEPVVETAKKTTTIETAKVVEKTESGSECGQAEQEHGKALSASESSDQLFHLRRSLRLCPQKAKYHLALGDLYKKLKRESDAKFEYNEALNVEPGNTEAKQQLETGNSKY